MNGNESGLTLRGTAIHAPRRGEIEILEDAILAIDSAGSIRSVTLANDTGHAQAKANHAADPNAITLSKDQFLLPGLIDLHIHAPQWPHMGKALQLPLEDWLQKNTFPLEARYADLAFARRVYASLVEALLANGTTTAVYYATIHNEASLALAETCLARGQRAFVGRVAMDDPVLCPDYYRDASPEAALAGTVAFFEQVRALPGNEHALVRPILTPRFIGGCSDRLLDGLARLALDSGAALQTHCSEGDWEQSLALERFGRTDTATLADFGLLTRRTVLAHANFIAGADLEMIGTSGAGIAHCPLSNFYFANAVFPLRAAFEKGLRVGLGTDISAGHSPSILEACRQSVAASRVLEDGVDPSLPAKRRGRPGSRIDFVEAFWLATAGGADVLDLPVGRFVPGCRFDAIVVDISAPGSNVVLWEELDEPTDALQKIVYNAGAANIVATWVEGRRVHSR
jgi:guanine deaminase